MHDSKPFIIKIQTSANNQKILIYNQSFTVFQEWLVKDVPEIRELLPKETPNKKYFWAEIFQSKLDIDDPAEEQDW